MATLAKKMKVSWLLGLVLFIASGLSAQDGPKMKYEFFPHFQVGANAGASLFFGDIKQYNYLPSTTYKKEMNMGGGITLNYQASPSVGFRLQGMYSELSGKRDEWNIYFESSFFETNLNTIINLNNVFGQYRPDRFISVYGTLGLSLMQYNTVQKVLGTDEEIKKVGYGYGSGFNGRTLQGAFLYGLGLNINVNERMNIQIETSNRTLDSDALDGWENGYALDTYNYTSLGLTYNFGFIKPKYMEDVPANYSEEDLAYIPVIMDDIKNEYSEVDEETTDEMISQIITENLNVNEVPVIITEYRVQILAKFKGKLTIDYISSHYIIPKYELSEEMYQGHYIYTVGSYATYAEARAKRDELRKLFGITDAFVVALRDNTRLDELPENE